MIHEVFKEDTAVYEINITRIPEKERPKLTELIEKKVEAKISELKNNDSLNMRNTNYSMGFLGPKYEGGNDVLRVYIRALPDEEMSEKTVKLDEIYKTLTSKIDSIFSDISTFRDEFSVPHSVKRTKDFGTKSSRNRPVWL